MTFGTIVFFAYICTTLNKDWKERLEGWVSG